MNQEEIQCEVGTLQVCPFGPARQPAHADELRLELSVTKQVHYEMVHPRLPVFDLREPTLREFVGKRPVLVVIDSQVDRIYGRELRSYGHHWLNLAGVLAIDGTESQKTWDQVYRICQTAMSIELGRHGVIVAVGGGVTLDIAGFAAAIYRRGIGYLRIPTTLLGIVDVSIGIKQGVNSGNKKNILGSFYPPMGNINDTRFLQSLTRGQLAAGFAEIIKVALLRDEKLFCLLEQVGEVLLENHFREPWAAGREVIERAESAMIRELQPNLFEGDLRRGVDFGHTFSPAFESASRYTLPHGHAVALDMLISTSVAAQRFICPPHLPRRLSALYQKLSIPLATTSCNAEDLLRALDSVRSHRGGHLNLVIPVDVGRFTFIQDVSHEELVDALRFSSAEQNGYSSACV